MNGLHDSEPIRSAAVRGEPGRRSPFGQDRHGHGGMSGLSCAARVLVASEVSGIAGWRLGGWGGGVGVGLGWARGGKAAGAGRAVAFRGAFTGAAGAHLSLGHPAGTDQLAGVRGSAQRGGRGGGDRTVSVVNSYLALRVFGDLLRETGATNLEVAECMGGLS